MLYALGGLQAARPRLFDQVGVGSFVEPNQQGPALPDRRRPEVAGRPDEEGLELRPARPGCLEVEVGHLLAAGDDIELIDALEDLEGILAGDGVLLGVDGRRDGGLLLRKEPLRSLAGNSAGAEVGPVEVCHGIQPFGGEKNQSIA